METRLTFIETTLDLGKVKVGEETKFEFVGNLIADSPQTFVLRGICGCTQMETNYVKEVGKVELKGKLLKRKIVGSYKKKVKITHPVEQDLYIKYEVIK